MLAVVAVATVVIAAVLIWNRADQECDDFHVRDTASIWIETGKPWWC